MFLSTCSTLNHHSSYARVSVAFYTYKQTYLPQHITPKMRTCESLLLCALTQQYVSQPTLNCNFSKVHTLYLILQLNCILYKCMKTFSMRKLVYMHRRQ